MATSLSFVTVDVFTNDRYKGNPLAIVHVREEDEPSTEAMQLIAREFNLSETVFLYAGRQGADGVQEWRMRIFITEAELPFAGK
jgi:PhzF family phenazine biosynthesis protein